VAQRPGGSWEQCVAPYSLRCADEGLPSHPIIINGTALHYQFGTFLEKRQKKWRSGVANVLKKKLDMIFERMDALPDGCFLRVRVAVKCTFCCVEIMLESICGV